MSKETDEVEVSLSKKRTRELEAKRLLFMMREAGIPEDMLEATPNEMSRLIVDPWSMCKKSPEELIHYIANKHRVWARTGSYVVIEGGRRFNEKRRDMMMRYCLLKAILANFNDVVVDEEEPVAMNGVARTFLSEVTLIIDLISKLPMLASFERARFGMMEKWSKVQVLVIREIDPARSPRENTDASLIIDGILRQRRQANLPTILTFMSPTDEIIKNARGGGGLGMELADIVSAAHSEAANIIRVQVQNEDFDLDCEKNGGK